MNTQLMICNDGSILAELKAKPIFLQQICEARKDDSSTKMYNDLKQLYWWSGMKQDISEFILKCLIYQQVKAKHQDDS
ncbi:integrase [Gossypium australe]|uniref:Integrase n=1 Tax=Gossypium australe TaxID=47621 RepID=A0A5B6VBF2_9ROSI|nr:integrase [Gossypium australe]